MTPATGKTAERAKPRGKESGTDRSATTAAIIAAISGLMGAVIGAGATYWATAQQLDRQDTAKSIDAHRAACVKTLQSMGRTLNALVELEAAVSVPNDPTRASKASVVDAASADFGDTLAPLYLDGTDGEIAIGQKFIDETGNAETALLKAAQSGTSATDAHSLIASAGNSSEAAQKIQQTFAAQCKVAMKQK